MTQRAVVALTSTAAAVASAPLDEAPPRLNPPDVARWAAWLSFDVATLALAVVSLMGYLGRFAWGCELASHFRVQYGALACLAALVYLIARRGKAAAVAGLLAATNLGLVLLSDARFAPPFGWQSRVAVGPEEARSFRIMSTNVWAENQEHEQVLQLVRAAKPDVAFFIEVNFTWAEALRELEYSYPYRRVVPAQNTYGLALFSRIPLDDVEVTTIGQPETALAIVARFKLDGQPVTMIGAHPYSPRKPARLANRNRQLQDLAALVQREKNPVIVIGDLNVTPWSPFFGDFLGASGLYDSRRGFGIQATWPTWCPPLGVPIDHCLLATEFNVRSRMVGPSIGSDHLPILVDVSWRE